jgi:glyoxylase-like metal-dependent hydrolase (beta-lactamase superfamily II)
MIIRQFFIPGIAHSSYLIGGAGSCLIVDPARDTDRYLAAASEEGMKIAGVLETHLHADFISGHREIADRTGAPVYMPEKADCLFPHTPVREGSIITMDDLMITVMETPGHTPEHVSYILTHQSRGNQPVCVFCGDTLFVGDVGRPDLFPGKAREMASALYTSLHERLMTLPDHCEVYPAHGAGSFCGRMLASKKWSTIGYERTFNEALRISDREDFIRHLTVGMPPAPDHFHRCSEINRRGPTLLSLLPAPRPLTPGQVREMREMGRADIVDIRRYDAFGGFHIPGSLNVDAEANFSTFAGWIVDPERNIILAGHNSTQTVDAVTLMHRVGIDSIPGFLDGGLQNWALAGYESDHVRILSVHELSMMRTNTPGLLVLDVRTLEEYAGYHIPGSVNIPWPELRTRSFEADSAGPVAVICRTGIRAGIACSILKRSGIHAIFNVAGGYSAWIAAGYE